MLTAEIDYPFDGHPGPGELRTVAAGVHWLRMPLKFALDHVNLWMLEDRCAGVPGWTAVDTGIAVDDIKRHWDTILTAHCTERPLQRIIATHCHPDHVGLANWLERKTGAPVWITQGELLTAYAWFHQLPNFNVVGMVEFFRGHGLDQARRDLLGGRGPTYSGRVDLLPTRSERMIDGDIVVIGPHKWRVIVGYGHSPEHASLYCEDLGVLISGDMLLPRISTNISVMASTPGDNPLARFLESIERLTTLPADTLVLPSHGRPFRGLHARVEQLRAHHRERCAALLAECASPRSACDLIPTLFQRELDVHQTMFAMGESIAHLNYMQHAGMIRREDGADGVIRFVA